MTQANSGSATERTPGTGDASAYAPLRRPIFRALWIASLASNLGTWLQNVGAGWLMTSLTPSPLMVALVQAATTLPVFLLAIPAGALADVIDRRRLLLAAQGWMLAAAASVAAVTAAGVVTPWLLLALTFALGLGFALNAPAWQAVVPEVVPRAEVPAAVALHGVSMNASRAVGPALGGVLVAAAGPEAAFLLNALSFLVVVWVLFRWDRPAAAGALPAERLVGAMRAGVRYVRHAPAFRAVLVRAAAFVSGAAGLWALLPAVARDHADWGPAAYGVMLGSLGRGPSSGRSSSPRFAGARVRAPSCPAGRSGSRRAPRASRFSPPCGRGACCSSRPGRRGSPPSPRSTRRPSRCCRPGCGPGRCRCTCSCFSAGWRRAASCGASSPARSGCRSPCWRRRGGW